MLKLQQGLHVVKAVFRIGMGEQIRRQLFGAVAADPAHGLKHGLHCCRITAHSPHPIKSQPVGLLLHGLEQPVGVERMQNPGPLQELPHLVPLKMPDHVPVDF